jgi:D-alanyl-D-alanine-carboxypeptidase/D-alanyl-D-alanine-endopeptidase
LGLRHIVCVIGSTAVVALGLARASTASAAEPAPAAFALPSDDEVRAILVDRVDVQRKSVGMVVGLIAPQGRRVISYGHLNQGDARPLDGDTVFEIGSVTKVFTALLLAEMVQRGEVALTDPLAKYLPAGVKVPEWNGRTITLIDLATQTSGLPFFPTDIPLADPAEAGRVVARYTSERVHAFLSSFALTREVGSRWEYSNLGFALLGEALARRAGADYETLVRTRITAPLGMRSTAITLSPEMRSRLGAGHDAQLHAAPEVDMPAFLAAGSFRSTANDLMAFVAACMGQAPSPLAPAMAAMLEPRRPAPGFQQALGWWIVSMGPGDDGFVFHGGQTLGYSSALACDPKTRVGVVVLSNGTLDDGGLAWHLMRPSFPMRSAAAEATRQQKLDKEPTLDAHVLDSYVGRYRVASGPTTGDLVTIEREGAALILKSPTSPPQGLRLHAETERTFFITEADLQVVFQTDAQGHASAIVFRFAGTDTPAPRVEDAPEPKQ